MSDVFGDIYKNNGWQNPESVSGHGSTLAATAIIRERIPKLFKELKVKTVLDAACGDYNWWRKMDLPGVKYTGVDVVPELIAANQKKYGDDDHQFHLLDITKHELGSYDVIFARDVFVHHTDATVQMALWIMRRSRSKYLLATTFPDQHNVKHIRTGEWRPINMAYHMGYLGQPLQLINEGHPTFPSKSLGLWRLW
jgi:2-polyprenyl-3-methyl-5-hydroxy-6-metoxy-1,4-benzoquinol methylase